MCMTEEHVFEVWDCLFEKAQLNNNAGFSLLLLNSLVIHNVCRYCRARIHQWYGTDIMSILLLLYFTFSCFKIRIDLSL